MPPPASIFTGHRRPTRPEIPLTPSCANIARALGYFYSSHSAFSASFRKLTVEAPLAIGEGLGLSSNRAIGRAIALGQRQT